MKTRIPVLLLCTIASSIGFVHAQGMLNKLKNKANQEVNKLEKGATSTSSSQTQAQPNKNKLSANVKRTVILKMHDDEILDFDENCIDLSSSLDQGQGSFILQKRTESSVQCIRYKNGSRTPVECNAALNNTKDCNAPLPCSYSALKEIEIGKEEFNKYVSNETESHDIQKPAYTDAQIKAMTAYMTPAQVEEFKKSLAEMNKMPTSYSSVKSSSIVFNGKKYGPFKQIQKFFLTQDGKNFYAIVMEENGKQFQNKMIASASAKTILLKEWDSPVSCFSSSDNSEFGYMAIGLTNQKRVITISSGKNYEMEMSVDVGEVWFSPSGNHVMYIIRNQFYRDGQVIKTFEDGFSPKPCDLFLSPDGQSLTLIKNGISFADGDYFQYPLKVTVVNVGGKPYFKWLAIENNEAVVYQKPY